jgi:hypothetical protein
MPPGSEGILIAEFNIERTAVPVPTGILDKYANVRNIAVLNLNGNAINLQS